MPRTRRYIALLALAAIGFTGIRCDHNPVAPSGLKLSTLEKRVVQSGNAFGLKLFREINRTEGDTNLFISPLSVSMALGMTLNGANGSTLEAMQQTLELAGLSEDEINPSYKSLLELLQQLDPEVIFEIANAIWYRQEFAFEPDFIRTNQTFFDAEVRGLDFNDPQSVEIINGWVSDKTHGNIEEVIDRIDRQTVMFLINAIYFKGTWTYEFDEERTEQDWFNLPDGSRKPCMMMNQSAEFPYLATEAFQAVDLPYGDGAFRMTILLPRPGHDLDSLIESLDPETWDRWMQDFEADTVILQLPRFSLTFDIELKDILSGMGMGIAFDPNRADFTRMYRPGGLFIEFVKHKTFVEVNEEGTEASGVTVVGIGRTSIGGSEPIVMRVDRPFLFAIREHQSGTILFVGKVISPDSK